MLETSKIQYQLTLIIVKKIVRNNKQKPRIKSDNVELSDGGLSNPITTNPISSRGMSSP